jgi:hypothetical protein
MAPNSVEVKINLDGAPQFVFSSPDTLFNLSMDRLQQEAIFMNNADYTMLLQKMPSSLRPFGQSAIRDYSKFYDNDVDPNEPLWLRRRVPSGSSDENSKKKRQKFGNWHEWDGN